MSTKITLPSTCVGDNKGYLEWVRLLYDNQFVIYQYLIIKHNY